MVKNSNNQIGKISFDKGTPTNLAFCMKCTNKFGIEVRKVKTLFSLSNCGDSEHAVNTLSQSEYSLDVTGNS